MILDASRHAPPRVQRDRLTPIPKSTNSDRTAATAQLADQILSPTTKMAPAREVKPAYRGPRIELLVIPECPYATLAEALIAVTLHELGLAHTPVLTTVIDTTAEAIRRRFTGSPSIVINGVDPWAHPDGKPAMACRATATAPAGLPDPHSLAHALCTAVLEDHRFLR